MLNVLCVPAAQCFVLHHFIYHACMERSVYLVSSGSISLHPLFSFVPCFLLLSLSLTVILLRLHSFLLLISFHFPLLVCPQTLSTFCAPSDRVAVPVAFSLLLVHAFSLNPFPSHCLSYSLSCSHSVFLTLTFALSRYLAVSFSLDSASVLSVCWCSIFSFFCFFCLY